MTPYRKLSQEEIDTAGRTNLVDFLSSIGEKLVKKGNSFFWESGGHHTLNIFGTHNHMYNHHAHGEVGNAVSFCRKYLNMTFQESVERLLDYSGYVHLATENQPKPTQEKTITRKPFALPLPKEGGIKPLYDYLHGKRGIDKRVIWDFIDNNSLYATKEHTSTGKEYSNIAFIAKDFQDKPCGALKRSFQDKGFKGNHKNSNMQDYCFRHDGVSKTGVLYVFEAPIDMLSYISFIRKNEISLMVAQGIDAETAKQTAHSWKNNSFLAVGGTYAGPVINYLHHSQQQGRDIQQVWLCHDNDSAGITAREKLSEKLEEMGYKGEVFCHFSKGKDWNEDLTNAVIIRDELIENEVNHEQINISRKTFSRQGVGIGSRG